MLLPLSPMRAAEEVRERMERLGSRDPDALDVLCRRLGRGALALVLLGAATCAAAGLLLALTADALPLLPLGLGGSLAAGGLRSLRSIARARRDFLRRSPLVPSARGPGYR